MHIMCDKPNFEVNDGTQKGKEQVAVAAVVSISEGLLRCVGKPALSQPADGCETPSPTSVGERMKSMVKHKEVSELVLAALLKKKLKAAFDVQKVDIVDGANGRELSLTGCIPGDDEAQAFSFRVSFGEDEYDDLHGLIAKLGLPEQPPVPEYSGEHDLIDKVGCFAGFETGEYFDAEQTESASIKLVGSGSSRDPIDSYLFNDVYLTFKGFAIQDIDPDDLWTFLCTLEHHGEFHALCTLYRIYELAD